MTWLVHLTFVAICAAIAWLFWVFGQIRFQWPSQWRVMDGTEILTVTGLTIAVFSGSQGLFRWLATPRLRLQVHSTSGPIPIRLPEYALHHIEVWNHDWPWFLRPLFLATAPEGCQAKFQYWKEPDSSISPEFNGQWLHGRWSDNPEPLVETPQGSFPSISASVTNRRLAKLFPTGKRGHIDAHPFIIAFAIKKEGDPDFYHFNDESYYRHGPENPWCNNDWQLGPGAYRINVRITGYGLLRAKTASFRLRNLGTRHQDFTLEAIYSSVTGHGDS